MNIDPVVSKLALFKQLYFPYPPHIEFHEQCKFLIQLGLATRGQPQMGMRVVALSGSGKSAAGLALVRLVEAQHPRTKTFVPVVYVVLEKAATSKNLMMSILEYFGDPYSSHGNEQVLKRRVKLCFERFKTMLMIIDEVQHLNYRSYAKNDVTDSLKRLLDDGVVPIVFMGNEEAEELFTKNIQLASRLIAPCDFKKLDLVNPADRGLFAGYVTKLDQAMVEKRILPELSNLQDPWVLTQFYIVSDGVVGRISRLMLIALEIALRRGASRIERYDLALAVDRWAIPNNVTKLNPFLQEPIL